MNKTNLNGMIVSIGNTSYKFTKATLLSADKAIAHIKKHKKLYKWLVAYIALYMSPLFIDFGKFFIYELIYFLANTPTNIALEGLLEAFIHLAKILCLVAGMYNIVKLSFYSLVENIKNK